jgi:methylthioribose-1-phosphate isomerase
LNLRPNKLNDEEILEVQNTKKQQNLLEQLNQARSMKNNIEISLKKMLTKEKDLNRTKKSIYEKMQKAKDNLSKDMRLNRKAIVEYYNKKLERLEEEINNLAPEIEKKKTRLDVVQNKIQLIERENNKIAS